MKREFGSIGQRPSMVDRNNCHADQDCYGEGDNENESDAGHVYNYRQRVPTRHAPRADGVYKRPTVLRNARPVPKLPSFTAKEDWTVLSEKLEAMVRTFDGNEGDKLDNLLPMIEGQACQFAFAQLPSEVLSDYHELTT
ncbi:hypothetical protein DPMN_141524 [Dreissena polymorpha]|uniref:Uncharacterized protein n=1 Tax=Dreissena polymorpha TaxID=45954 RepID=A0A9D4GDM8_DREPO|nr:hypothetical protein DPMN_141524 [Dreissena polymorpha]